MYGEDNSYGVREKLSYVFTVIAALIDEGFVSEFHIQKPSLKEAYNKVIVGKNHKSLTLIGTDEAVTRAAERESKVFRRLLTYY